MDLLRVLVLPGTSFLKNASSALIESLEEISHRLHQLRIANSEQYDDDFDLSPAATMDSMCALGRLRVKSLVLDSIPVGNEHLKALIRGSTAAGGSIEQLELLDLRISELFLVPIFCDPKAKSIRKLTVRTDKRLLLKKLLVLR